MQSMLVATCLQFRSAFSRCFLFVLFVALLCLGNPSHAQLVSSLTTTPDTADGGVAMMAGQFTLTGAATIASATASLVGASGFDQPNSLTASLLTDAAGSP